MEPTRIKTTTITKNISEFLCYPIDPMSTPLVCNVAGKIAADNHGEGESRRGSNTLQSGTIPAASDSLVKVIPMQTIPHEGIATSTNVMAAVGVMPQMAIIKATTNESLAVAQPSSTLGYYQVPQGIHGNATNRTLNFTVDDTSHVTINPDFTEKHPKDKRTDESAVLNIGNVSLQPTETSTAGAAEPTILKTITLNSSPNASAIIKVPQQQQLIKPQLTNISKSLTKTSKMMTSNYYDSQSLEKNVGTFSVKSPSKNRPLPFSSNANSLSTTDPSSVTSSLPIVAQISNSVTLSLAQQKKSASKMPPKLEEAACVTLEKSITAKENKKLTRPKNCKDANTQHNAAMKKQESLLKSKPVQRIIVEHRSPRSKRSKSLNVASFENVATERRCSTASEGKAILVDTSKKQKDFEDEMSNKDTVDIDKTTNQKATFNACVEMVEGLHERKTSSDSQSNSRLPKENTLKSNESEESVITDGESSRSSSKNYQSESSDETLVKSKLTVTTEKEEQTTPWPEISLLSIKEEPKQDYDDDEVASSEKHEDIVTQEVRNQPELNPPDNTLLCEEHILITSSSSSSSVNNSIFEPVVVMPTNSNSPMLTGTSPAQSSKSSSSDLNSSSSVIGMLSTFNMLSWKERIGAARNTNLRFQLNEFNLLQIHERCPPRHNLYTAYEKPIYERESHSILENEDPLLYLCRRCNCHGSACEFLAPEFCSVECLKRDTRKRQQDRTATSTRKRPRKEAPAAVPGSVHQQQPVKHSLPTSSISSKPCFRWSTYLTEKYGETAAPVDLFLNPFPTGPNNFQIGMKLEAIDPENCSLFCVCTVADIQGYRLNLTFDGYDHMYNFWVNADSMDIFPPGWCAKTNRILQPPNGIETCKFNWAGYFAKEKAVAAPRQLFTHLNSSASPMRNPFKVGVLLEAEDLNDTGKLCVATVSDVLDDRIRIHFNGWDDCYDYWVDISSPYIHPCGWHEGRQQLIAPPDFEDSAFSWPDYLRERGRGSLAPPSSFAARDPIDFRTKMKLEVVDPRNPVLIRPATVVARKGHRIKLHLDLWPSEYCFWLEDDSPDLHPIGWCDATGHDLEPPPGYRTRTVIMPCIIPGCRGIGNAKVCHLNTHSTVDACPYAPENWSAKLEKPPRIECHEIERKTTAKTTHLDQQNILNKPRNESLRARRNNDLKHISPKSTNPKCTDKISEHLSLLDTVKTKRNVMVDHPERAFELFEQESDSSKNDAVSVASKWKPNSSPISNTLTVDLFSLKIAKEYLCDYGPRLQQNYNIWQHNLNWNYDDIKKNPLHWSTEESTLFVENLLKCSNTARIFTSEDIDGPALLSLQQSDLTDILELKLGNAVKLYAHILQLRTWAVTKFNLKTSERF